jgi:hypothetical protein
MALPRAIAGAAILLLFVSCRTPDPQKELEVADLETYYAIERKAGETLYISPVARFTLRNKSREPTRPIQASANFRRVGEEGQTWGGAWVQVSRGEKPLVPGAEITVVLQSEGHYTTTGEPAGIFTHALFKDVTTEVFLRVGASGWVKMASAPVERRIGPKSVQETK